MLDPDRDDSPTAFNLARNPARREVLVGALLMGGLSALAALPASSATVAWSDESAAQFIEISSLLIPHRLSAAIGKRIGNLMSALNPSLSEHVTGLLAIAKAKNAKVVEEFFPDVPEGPLRETALSIISAWYLGVVTDAPDAEVFALEYALMYQPTADVMTIPSYAVSGPNGWTADAPPLSNMPEF
jgi:fructose 5-dehydrogenase small subunit